MKTLYAAVAAVALLPAAAAANERTASGSANGLNWEASSTVVGQTGTGTAAAGGDPAYLAPNREGYSGVVGLRMEYSNNTAFVCSGSLLSGGRILTAAHCVSDGFGTSAGLVKTTAYFYNGVSQGDDHFVYPSGGALLPGVTAIDISAYSINTNYTGEVIDQNDIAVLFLKDAAPAYAQAYELYDNGDLTGDGFNVAGYGTRSITGGVDGTTDGGAGAGVGRRRQGDNIYDFALGDAAFDGFFTDRDASGENFFGKAEIEFSYISDFDRTGFAANSQSCRLASVLVAGGTAGATALGFCTNGVGPLEVGIAGGDSGGAAFINGQIASVNSYSLSFGANFGDFKPGLQSSWGELNGFVPTFIHTNFINAVPEPGTWAMMILGFGFVGGALRRRAKSQLSFA